MTLQGSLNNCSASQLLNLINLAHKSGTLTIFATGMALEDNVRTSKTATGSDMKRARIVFQDGVPVMSFVDMRNMVALLRRTGKLTPTQAELVEQRIGQANEKAQALLLIAGNYATRDEIMAAFEEQLREDIHNILMWVDGSFLFEEHVPDMNEHIAAPIDLGDVLVEHGTHVREVKRMTQEIPNLSATLRFTADVDERLQRSRLSARAWRVISAVKDNVSIRQIARINNMDALEVRRVVIGLIQAGVLEMGEPVQDADDVEFEDSAATRQRSTDPTVLDTLIEGIQNAADKLVGPDSDASLTPR
jgi:hypothetical protein